MRKDKEKKPFQYIEVSTSNVDILNKYNELELLKKEWYKLSKKNNKKKCDEIAKELIKLTQQLIDLIFPKVKTLLVPVNKSLKHIIIPKGTGVNFIND